MSELTWLIILGVIAITFPLAITSLYSELDIEEPEYKSDFYNETVYNEFLTYNCSNVNLTLMNDYKHYFNFPPPDVLEKEIGCALSSNYISNFIQKRLIPYEDFINKDLTNDTGIQKMMKFFGLENFYKSISSLTQSIQILIYSLYGLFFTWLIIKAVTLL